MIAQLIREDTFRSELQCSSWEELVDLTAAPLVADKTIEPAYIDAIKEAVAEHGSYMVIIDDVALFHGRPEAGVNRVGLSLATLQQPVYLGDNRITVSFVLAAPGDNSHLELMQELAVGLMDEEFVGLLRNGGPRAQIISEFNRLEKPHEKR